VNGRPDNGSRSAGYFLKFGFTAVILGGLTLFLVLVVLPRRFILNAGLRESGVSFPSEAAPFDPPPEVARTPPPPVRRPAAPAPGPAEVLWASVGPLLESGRAADALPLFKAYLEEHPQDQGARKEYAITLQKAGFAGEAVLVLDDLLSKGGDPAIRLLLARALRDRGRTDEASVQYRILLDESPSDAGLALEWGEALAWAREYDQAVGVLSRGLAADSSLVDLRIALSQTYYWSGRLDEADAVLADLDEATLRAVGGLGLKRDILVALTPPETVPETIAPASPLTTWDKIALATAAEDHEKAAALFQEALREAPRDTAAWKAYADVLQFGLNDLEGARAALLALENLGADDPALQFRLAQLAIWSGRNGEASTRLEDLLVALGAGESQSGSPGEQPFGPAEIAEVTALLGDLRRWDGSRAWSGDTYRAALREDSTNFRAKAGLAEVEAAALAEVEDVEQPGVAGSAYSIQDSDEFMQLDLALAGKTIQDHWVWGFRSGTRWLGGVDLTGADHTDRGLFLELEAGRWWRWGTVRTGLNLALEEDPSGGNDVSVGATLHFTDLAGFRTDLGVNHGPAYPLTMTLQSVYNGATLDRVTANLSRGIGPRWSLSLAGDASWIRPGPVEGSSSNVSLRLEAGMSVGRLVTNHLILGVNARALAYSKPSPVQDGLRLFWDPNALIAGGFYAEWSRDLTSSLDVRARLNPSLALIDERVSSGFETVPHFSAEAGISHQGSRFRTMLDAFYYQGRFDRYKAYGLRVSVGARDWFRKEEEE